jgi:UDP-glucose 4-epimerase
VDTFLVTGGAGFIGSHLTDALLASGAHVRILDDLSTGKRAQVDPRCELVVGDVADAALLRAAMHGTAGCFHLAAIASVARGNADWRGTHRINQSGSIAVFEAARDAGRLPVVYASSAAVYGDLGGATAREDAVCVPRTAYGADKLGSELHARVAWQVHGVPTLGLRFFNVYGVRQDPSSPYSGVVSVFAARLARGEALPLHGDGSQTRDFVHVGDVVAHLRAAMRTLRTAPGARVLNVCTGRATSIRDLGGVLARLFGTAPAFAPGPARPGDIARSLGDPAQAVAALGIAAATTLEQGLAQTVA